MKNKFVLAVALLGLAMLACRAVTGGGTTPVSPLPTDTDLPVATDTESTDGDVLLSDDFKSIRWGTGTDADSSVEYTDEALRVIVFTENFFVWSTPDDRNYENVHIEVTVINNGTHSTTAFGILCNQQSVNSSFYYFAITPAGEYAIAKAENGKTDVFLTNNDQWGFSDAIAQDAASYRVGADCGRGRLALYVDGVEIDSVSDSSYTSGRVGVFVWSGEEVASADVSFDDFLMTRLP